MCLTFLWINNDTAAVQVGNYSLILVNNRDEYYNRPTRPLHAWADGMCFGPMDMEPGREGGSWLSMTRTGKIGNVLNILFDHYAADQSTKIGRGNLIPDFLQSHHSAASYIHAVRQRRHVYNPFNLLLLENSASRGWNGTAWCSQTDKAERLEHGCYAFGNAPWDQSWRKVTYGQQKFEQVVSSDTSDEATLVQTFFDLLSNRDELLPDENYAAMRPAGLRLPAEEHTRMFVRSADYGTRTQSVLLCDRAGQVAFYARDFHAPHQPAAFTDNVVRFSVVNS